MFEGHRTRSQQTRQPIELVEIKIESAEDLPRLHSPDNYRPLMSPEPIVYDDEVNQLEGLWAPGSSTSPVVTTVPTGSPPTLWAAHAS